MTSCLKSSVLKIYMGCMFSGKSTSLLNEAQRFRHITDNILMVNHVFDLQRNECPDSSSGLGQIKTHDNKSNSALMVQNLCELLSNDFFYSKYSSADVVIIDEAQFYDDLYTFLSNELQRNDIRKIFIVGGLSGDFRMNNIGQLHQILPLADEVVKLQAYCVFCKDGTPASFTKRITNDDQVILVGSASHYAPVCRLHFHT